MKGSLDAAIAAFDEALTLDAGLTEARDDLVLVLARKAKDLEGSDLDAAYVCIEKAKALLPQSTAWPDVGARVTNALQQRLAKGLALNAPAIDAVLGTRGAAVRRFARAAWVS